MIISHTPHQIRDGQIYGFGPTVREINYLASIFETIVHVAPLDRVSISSISTPYVENVKFVSLPMVGGEGIYNKLKIFLLAPTIIRIVNRELKKVDFFQFRAPTSIGVYLIPFFIMFSKKQGWFKYAGNWNDRNMPISYRFQKWLLKHITKRKVTINGKWPRLRSNFLSFENPCLSDQELSEGLESARSKNFYKQLTLLFVGRIEREKGMDILVHLMNSLKNHDCISELILIGEGRLEYYRGMITSKVITTFTGGLIRSEINQYYKKAHILILPSLSEGFPKVVAEAAAYGCVPVVTNVSALSQYISDTNGLLFKNFDPQEMSLQLETLLANRIELAKKSQNIIGLAKNFTYSYYLKRIQDEVI